jgi:hypothetical protein
VAVFLLFPALGATPAEDSGKRVVTYEVANLVERDHDLVVTFGTIFVRGDVPNGTPLRAVGPHGEDIPLQVDRKATHPDHSLRHAVVTLSIEKLAPNTTMPVTLFRGEAIGNHGSRILPSDLPPGFDADITLASRGKRWSASVRALLARTKPDIWLSGPLVSEWWVAGPFTDQNGVADPHLRIQFGVRCYGRNRPVRLEVNVDNDWTFVPHPRTESYDAKIVLNGKTVFEKSGMIQPAQTRWRKGFWWGEPIDLYVRQNLTYLKKSGAVPNYDPQLVVSQFALREMYSRFEDSDREPMAAGILMKYMPTTGGRPDIAPLPQWQALYLLSMDPRMYQVTLQTADLGASFPSHYRNEKTGRPATFEDYPNISTHSNYVGRPGQLERTDPGGYADPLVPDAAHEPALDFVPYLVTGDRFYLEELEFWSQWNAMGTAPEYHGFAQGLVTWDQARAQAWSLRTLAQAAFVAPDSDPLKPALRRELAANIEWYRRHVLNGSDRNNLGILWQSGSVSPYDGGRGISPWQDDFFTWAVGYVQAIGDVNALPLLQWKATFPISRMIAPGFCWIFAPSYTLIAQDNNRVGLYSTMAKVFQATLSQRIHEANPHGRPLPCAGKEMAQELGLHPGEMVENAAGTDSYSAYLQPALAAAVDSGAPGGHEAWELFRTRSVRPDFASEPGWDIVPMGVGQ